MCGKTCVCTAKGTCAPAASTPPAPAGCLLGGDEGWLTVHRELRSLHVGKGADYGRADDRLANYTETSAAVGQPDEFTCWLRIHEKCVRALNMIRDGRADDNDEAADVAALAIAAEALRRRRNS